MHASRLTVRILALATIYLAAARLLAADATAWPVPDWQTASPESQGMSAAGVEKVRDWLRDNGSKTGLVVRHGRIVGEWYFADAQPSSKYLVYSTSKSFASTAAGVAIAQGKIKLETRVGDLLPDVSPPEKAQITVRQILSMTTGVHNNPKFGELPQRFTYALQEAPMDHAPGTKWQYNNTGLALLGPLLFKATGEQLDALLKEQVFKPIGIRESDWSWDSNEGYTLPYSGLHITARALARFGLLFLNKGKWQDRQVVSAEWVAEATSPSQDLEKSYGYLWWNNSANKWKGGPTDAYAALGRFDNNMFVVPSLDLIVLRQVGNDSGNNRKINQGELLKLAADAVTETGSGSAK